MSVSKLDDSYKISLFLSPLDVHVQYAPFAGKVTSQTYHKGGHYPAFNQQADYNERHTTSLDTTVGPVTVTRFAGSVFRRVVSFLDNQQDVITGQPIGIIKLGSRVDITLPSSTTYPLVVVGQSVKAGVTRIADVK